MACATQPLLVAARQIMRSICTFSVSAVAAMASRQRLRAPTGSTPWSARHSEKRRQSFLDRPGSFRKIADARLGFAALRFHVIAVDRDQAELVQGSPHNFMIGGLAAPYDKEPTISPSQL